VAEISQVAFELSRAGDQVAGRTGWAPIAASESSFRTPRLVRVNSSRIEFRVSTVTRGFYLLFLFIGLAMMAYAPFAGAIVGGWVIPLLLGSVLTLVGAGLLQFGTAPTVLDKTRGSFRKGRRAPFNLLARIAPEQHAELKDIYALQLLSEHNRGDKKAPRRYEINLVLNSGRRINIVDHASHTNIRSEARALSLFLGKPVWDATV